MSDDQQPPLDVFLFKLLAGIGVVLAIILLPYVSFYIFQKVPQAAAILRDFDTETPVVTSLVISLRWAFFAPAVLGVIFGLIASFAVNRAALRTCWICVLLTIASVVLMWQAVEAPITSVMNQLSGG